MCKQMMERNKICQIKCSGNVDETLNPHGAACHVNYWVHPHASLDVDAHARCTRRTRINTVSLQPSPLCFERLKFLDMVMCTRRRPLGAMQLKAILQRRRAAVVERGGGVLNG